MLQANIMIISRKMSLARPPRKEMNSKRISSEQELASTCGSLNFWFRLPEKQSKV
jgi:hypothetical protein